MPLIMHHVGEYWLTICRNSLDTKFTCGYGDRNDNHKLLEELWRCHEHPSADGVFTIKTATLVWNDEEEDSAQTSTSSNDGGGGGGSSNSSGGSSSSDSSSGGGKSADAASAADGGSISIIGQIAGMASDFASSAARALGGGASSLTAAANTSQKIDVSKMKWVLGKNNPITRPLMSDRSYHSKMAEFNAWEQKSILHCSKCSRAIMVSCVIAAVLSNCDRTRDDAV